MTWSFLRRSNYQVSPIGNLLLSRKRGKYSFALQARLIWLSNFFTLLLPIAGFHYYFLLSQFSSVVRFQIPTFAGRSINSLICDIIFSLLLNRLSAKTHSQISPSSKSVFLRPQTELNSLATHSISFILRCISAIKYELFYSHSLWSFSCKRFCCQILFEDFESLQHHRPFSPTFYSFC